MNIPNAITVLRIILVPFFIVCLIKGYHGYALFIFIMAGLTDALDGAIARMTGSMTEFGALLDPIADKALVLSAFIVLTFLRQIPLWLTAAVIIRDSIILSGSLALYRLGLAVKLKPTISGKATTFTLFFYLVVTLLGGYMGRELMLTGYLAWLATALIVVSGGQYIVRGYLTVLGREGA